METRPGIALERTAPLPSGLCAGSFSAAAEGPRWYVVHTRPFAEMLSAVNLGRLGYRVCYPCFHKTTRHARRTTKSLAPLFPRYLFVSFDITRDRWRCINSTRGVVRLVMQGEKPHPVPAGVIESILRYMNDDGTIRTLALFEPGQVVRIENGPLADLVATFERCEPDGRARVLTKLLGQIVSVVLSRETFATAA